MSTNLFDFIKSAAEYSQETSDVVTAAYSIVEDMTKSQQKTAALVPNMVAKMESLARTNGQPFIPDGMSKVAAAQLNDHVKTLGILNHVLGEYHKLKTAYDNQAPSLGTVGTTKQASTNRAVRSDGPESQAMLNWRERLLNI